MQCMADAGDPDCIQALSESAVTDVEKMRQKNSRLEQSLLGLLSDLDAYLSNNNTEGFGCACTPEHKCGPCSRHGIMSPLIQLVDKSKKSEPELSDLIAERVKNEKQRLFTEKALQSIITDEEIERVHGNANFGPMSKRSVVNSAVLKCASGWHQGYTSTTIAEEHGLITKSYKLTDKGKKYLWACYSKNASEEV